MRSRIISLLSFIVCLIIVILEIFIINYDSTSGREYEKLKKDLKELEMTNSLLTQKVASNSSLTTIAVKAKLLGFDVKKSVISLYNPQPLAAIANTL